MGLECFSPSRVWRAFSVARRWRGSFANRVYVSRPVYRAGLSGEAARAFGVRQQSDQWGLNVLNSSAMASMHRFNFTRFQ